MICINMYLEIKNFHKIHFLDSLKKFKKLNKFFKKKSRKLNTLPFSFKIYYFIHFFLHFFIFFFLKNLLIKL